MLFGIVETLPVAVYATDAEGRLTYFNDAARRLSGRTPELGTDKWCVTWKIFLPDGTALPHDQCPMALALKGVTVPNGIECIAERPDGTRFWFTPYPAVLRDGEGRIVGGVNVLVDITDRKNAEIEATEQFRTIIETTPECVKIVARDGTLLFMNPQGLGMVGAASAEAIVGTKVYDLIAPEDRERFREFNERVCRGEKGTMEFDIVSLQGVRRNMECHAAPLQHVDGSTVQLAITHDISEKKHAERDGLLLSAIIDFSDDAIISKDLNGIITSWNKSAERIFGFTPEEAIGKTVAELLIPEDRQEEEPKILARLCRGERVDHFETVRRRKDGVMLDVSLTISPVKDSSGSVIGASKIARDITPRKRTEYDLRASEERFRLAQQAAKIGIFEWDVQTDVNTWSRELEELYGLQPGTFKRTQSAWENLVHPEDRAGAVAQVDRAFATGMPVEGEWRVIWPDGTVHWLAGRFQVYRDALGKPARLTGVNFEITERKRIENELLRANADLEQFAFSASHDLQEPLRTVKVYSELLAQRYGEGFDEDARQCVQYLQSGASRMETLVRDLLTYTQLMKLDIPTEKADANEALQAALDSLAGAIAESGATIDCDALPSLRVHGTHLQQLFQNLIGNAIKYRSPERVPSITVRAERAHGQWIFAVSDNGIGIAPEYKETIFVIFKRLHGNDRYSGSGVGLAICQRIVERYHGRIWVESEPGVGSTFRCALPA
jgi:two-component system, chemotaxis family, sensor kinase Cph1